MPYYMTTGAGWFSVTEDPYWQDEWGHRYDIYQSLFKGKPIASKYLPKSGYLDNRVKSFPPFVGRPYWLCSDDVRELIEQFEPGQHRFFPFELRKSKRGDVVAKYHILNIVGTISAINLDRSGPLAVQVTAHENGKTSTLISALNVFGPSGEDIALHEDRIGGRHLWLDAIAPDYSNAFISDEFHDAIQPFLPIKRLVDFKKTI